MPAAEIGTFKCTVDLVYALCPEAERVTDSNQSGLNTPITEVTVEQWVLDLDASVNAAIGAWSVITGTTRDEIVAAGRRVVADGAASYLEAARYPTRASLNDSTYAGVLWERYLAGVAALRARVTEILDTGGEGVVEDPTVGVIVASFPCTWIPDEVVW